MRSKRGAGLRERPQRLGVEAQVKEALAGIQAGGGGVRGPGFKLGLLRVFDSCMGCRAEGLGF